MKRHVMILIIAIFLYLPVSVQAVLIDRGIGMIYDTKQDITWLQDANYAKTAGLTDTGMMNWDSAMRWADNLVYHDYYDWRLPSAGENPVIGYNTTGSEMGHLYYTSEPHGLGNLAGVDISNTGGFINLEYGTYWTNTESDRDPQNAWTFFFGYGAQSPDRKYLSNNYYAWAVRDGDYGPSVSTDQSYLTDYLTLEDTFTFEYWFEMGIEPTEFNFDVLFFFDGEWLPFGGLLTNFDGSSEDWSTFSMMVPEWARGRETQIKFVVADFPEQTDPTVYLRNIGSNPVPEPATFLLLGFGLVGLGIKKIRLSNRGGG